MTKNESNQSQKLSSLGYHTEAVILGISDDYRGEERKRLLDLGFVKGTKIKVQNISPLGNPTAYNLRDTLIALRKEQADSILIKILKDE